VDQDAQAGNTYRYRLAEYASGGTESCEFVRTPAEFAFSALARPVAGGAELSWPSRTDGTYDLLCVRDLNLPLKVLDTNLPAAPLECVFTNLTGEAQGFYRVRLVP
jgi:hypothetical protein